MVSSLTESLADSSETEMPTELKVILVPCGETQLDHKIVNFLAPSITSCFASHLFTSILQLNSGNNIVLI